jgi:C4-dicarboxylate-binding protein DctP
VIVNKKFWEGLPAEIRTTLEQAMKEATAFERNIAKAENEDALNKVRTAKTTEIYILPNEERARWHAAFLPVHKEFENSIGRDLIQMAYAVAAQVQKEKAAGK